MSQRFQIEDLVVQDTSGVVFRALDTETGQYVALRRFFPNGAKGEGLGKDEQDAYQTAVERLSAVSHPALRSVICGGCDPIDSMPFIAAEWIEGKRLQAFIDHAPLSPEEATSLLTQALDVCLLLSQVLGEEAVLVETDLRAIVVGAEGTGRGFAFWIAPLKWLGKSDGTRGLESLVTLTEEIMGWRGKVVTDQAGNGIGAWLRWLRGCAKTTSIRKAREKLASCVGTNLPGPPTRSIRVPTLPLAPSAKKKKPSKTSAALVFSSLALLAAGAGGWALTRDRAPHPPAKIPATSETFNPGDHDQLIERENKRVAVEGTFVGMSSSIFDDSIYLLFSKDPTNAETRGAVRSRNAPADLAEAQLVPLVGKKIRLLGKVDVDKANNRPVIVIENRGSIQVLE